jgi:hypothetical protein
MDKDDIVITAEFLYFLGLESHCIVCDDLDWESEPGKKIVF